MKRRDLLLAVPVAASLARTRDQDAKKKLASKAVAKVATVDPVLDQQMLAMMLLLMKRTSATYPMIDLVKGKTQEEATALYPVFGKFDKKVYKQTKLHLNNLAEGSAAAIQAHQQATQQISMDVQASPYPNNECPLGASINKAVAALLP